MTKVHDKTEKDELAEAALQSKQLDNLIQKVKVAQKAYASFSQEQVDKIFREAAIAANNARIELALQAREETGMGVAEDKVIKNHFASEYIYNAFKDTKTCGEIDRDDSFGIIKIAEPVGIIAGVIPTTNPTSTTIFKALLALKTRNGIIFSPHPRAKKSTLNAARIVLEAAVKAGAPQDIIGCIETPSVVLSTQLMKHDDTNLILATGGPGMVKAAYSSGKPAVGVGPGNTPAVIDETADIEMAVNSILVSKTFDNGMICASEQSVVVVDTVYNAVKEEFNKRGAWLLSKEDARKVGAVVIVDKHINAKIVGQSAYTIAELAGVKVPKETKVLIGEASKIDVDEPFAYEKLSPVLGMFKVKTFEEGTDTAARLLDFQGIGHTSVLYTDQRNTDRISHFGARMKTARTLINTPASHGAIGDLYNFKLAPSLTLGCGSWGSNSVSENVGPQHLLNIKTVAARRENMLWLRIPPKVYHGSGCLGEALKDLDGKKRAFIVTDRYLKDNGHVDSTVATLEAMGIVTEVFSDVLPDPTLKTVRAGTDRMNVFRPDTVIAIGGGSPMDAAKIMWLLYEHPNVEFDDLAMRFMDVRKRVYKFPKMGEKATLVCIPTTSGTGSEVTPFAVITDEATGMKYPLADYELTPQMAICDADFVMNLPLNQTSFGGLDALVHAIEARVSIVATEYTNAMAMEAIRIIFKYLPRAYKNGPNDRVAREKIHNAASIAGIAFANAFLGITHSMAHQLGAEFHVPHGLANAILMNNVIRFNATDKPTKQGTFSQYKAPKAKDRYAAIADSLNLGGNTEDEKVELLIKAIENLQAELDIPQRI